MSAPAGPRPAYSEVMEDWEPVSAGLELRANDVVVSVSSAGDNVFNAALEGPRRVFGVDIAPQQTALCRLKEAALRALGWEPFAQLVGSVPCTPAQRRAILDRLPYERVAELLPTADLRAEVERDGLAACGQLAQFLGPLRAGLHAVVGEDALRTLITDPDRRSRRRRFDALLGVPAVAEFLGAALNRSTIADTFIPAQAWDRMAEPEFGRFYLGVLERLTVDLEPASNPFLHRIWLDRFPSPTAVPAYLREDRHPRLLGSLDRISWHTADIGDFLATFPPRSVDAFNLSNVLDWCGEEDYARVWGQVDRVATGGARVFLRSFLRRRSLPGEVEPSWLDDPERARSAAEHDRVGYFARYETWTRVRDRE